MRERYILIVTLLVLGLVALGVAAASWVRPLPLVASDRAQLLDQLLRVFFGLATAVFVGAQGLLLFAAVRGRLFRPAANPGNPNGSVELIWLAVPTAIVLVLSVYSIRVMLQMEAPRPNPLRVEVTASQFVWEFHYPGSGVTSSVLHLPAGRPTVLEFRSQDVIHSFWVPAFGGKVDALPDRVTRLTLTPVRNGVYAALCAEYCGAGHTAMAAKVQVEDPALFDRWLQSGGEE